MRLPVDTSFRFVKFCIVGASGALLQFSLVYLLTEKASLYYMISLAIAILLVTIWNFAWNLKWTFKHDKSN